MSQGSAQFDREVEERLVRYAKIDTTSSDASKSTPSTECQYDLLNLLVGELKEIGVSDVQLTGYGAVIATIPGNSAAGAPAIAFLAHVDTTEAFSGTNVKPVVHRNYDGSDITFSEDPNLVLSPHASPYLKSKVGEDIITASGDTLLGADDKAGVAIIMAMARHLLSDSDVVHGPIRICFTPDEEIGRGVHENLPGDLNVKVAYTLDGAELGEIVYETFSADRGDIHITGVSAHPGQAKGILVNALHLAAKIVDTLPKATLTPETTSDREGFIHLVQIHGNPAAADLYFILRDFELDELQRQDDLLQLVCAAVQATEPRATIACKITPQYRNMRYWLEKDMRPVELAREAATSLAIDSLSTPTRGGTDGSRLTEKGVPTPNLFTGMQEIHGPLEWISVQDMSRATEFCVKLSELWGNEKV